METIYLAIISSILAPILVAGFKIVWNFLDKKFTLKINAIEKKIDDRNTRIKKDVGTIYNIISAVLSTLKSSRVYIIQPHPLGKNEFISVVYEVTDMGVQPIKDKLVDFPAANMPCFVGDISSRDFLYFKSISMMKGKRSRAFFANAGSDSLIIKKLEDDQHDWVGSLVVDFMGETNIAPDYAKSVLQDAADKIQFILPAV